MDKLAQGSLLVRNTVWNLIGYDAPLLVKGLGTDRFEALTLA